MSLMFMRRDDCEFNAHGSTDVDETCCRLARKLAASINSDLRRRHSNESEVLLQSLGRVRLGPHRIDGLLATQTVHDGHRVQIAMDLGDLHVHQVYVDDLVRILRWH
jgi:hypothetical protein